MREPDIDASYAGKRILVTGGGGYIGSRLVRRLGTVPCRLSVLARKPGSVDAESPHASLRIVHGDIREKGIWNTLLKDTDYVFHLAAQTSVRVAAEDPERDYASNVAPVAHIIETARRLGCAPCILLAGTATQVGLTESLPVSEREPDHPVTVYDRNKLLAQRRLQQYAGDTEGTAVTLRLANVYGPGPRSSSPDRGVVNRMVQAALRGEDLVLFDGGRFVRDYVYIDDVVRAFLMAGLRKIEASGKYYLVGSGQGATVRDMAMIIRGAVRDATGHSVGLVDRPFPGEPSPIDRRNFVADITRIRTDIGWQPAFSLEDGIRLTVDHFRNPAIPRRG